MAVLLIMCEGDRQEKKKLGAMGSHATTYFFILAKYVFYGAQRDECWSIRYIGSLMLRFFFFFLHQLFV